MKLKVKKIFIYLGLGIVTLIIVGLIGGYLANPELAACATINFSDNFVKHQGEIFISKDTPQRISDTLLFLVHKADKRVCDFWKVKQGEGNPKIIFCYSNELYNKYSRGAVGKTVFSPLGAFIIIGMNFIDLDKISHEICHTELFSRLGYFKITREIPVWFNEGLALQVDYRKEFSRERFLFVKDSIKSDPKLSEMNTVENFYNKDYYIHFLKAGYEVGNWLDNAGNEGLKNLISGINNGKDFRELYLEN
jgi:hypothetical protein